jgi:hypothetical protein
MPTVIERLQAEHGRLGRLVQLLNDERSLRSDPGAPNIALLVDALYYLTIWVAAEMRAGAAYAHSALTLDTSFPMWPIMRSRIASRRNCGARTPCPASLRAKSRRNTSH